MLPVLAVLLLLNITPIAFAPIHTLVTPVTIIHSHFFAGLLAMGTLGFAVWRLRGETLGT
jgi:hypothetical protein